MTDHTRLLGGDPARARYDSLVAVLGGPDYVIGGTAAAIARLSAWTDDADVSRLVEAIEQSKGLAAGEDHITLCDVAELVNASEEVDANGSVVIALPLSLVSRIVLRDVEDEEQ